MLLPETQRGKAMNLNHLLSIPMTIVILLLPSCNEVPMNFQNNSVQLSNKDINSSLKTVGNMHIFFGHKSVGNNILVGINDISKDS